MFFNAITLFVAAAVAQSALAADCSRHYTVQSGDICDTISASQKVSTFQLAAVNNGKINSACSNLMPGEDLCLGTAGEDCQDIYIVAANDSCEGIATSHNTNSTILRLNNPQINDSCDNIYIGEVLCVANTVTVPPIPSGGVVVPVVGAPAQPDATPIPITTVSVTPTAAPTSKPSAVANNAAAANDDDNDLDCDDDDDTTATTTTQAPPASTGTDDDDDADLPFCDEIEDN